MDPYEFLDTFQSATHGDHRDVGLRLSFVGPTAIVEAGDQILERPWSVLPRVMRRGWVEPAWDARPRLLLADGPISDSAAREARERGDWYLDTQGNAYVRAPGVLVDVRGRRAGRSSPQSPGSDRARGTNLMSARRAQVIFALLTWPELLHAPLRFLAGSAGVSVSMAHNARTALEEERYLVPGADGLDRRDVLVDQWANAFPLGLGKAIELGRFVGDPDPGAWREKGDAVYVSGEQAAGMLRAGGLTLYVPALDTDTLWRSRWRRAAPDESPNILVRRTFWTPPWPDSDRDPDGRPSLGTAPPLLVYADLLASHEPRQREAADVLRGEIGGH